MSTTLVRTELETGPYLLSGLGVAERAFSERFPDFDPDGGFAELRRVEYGRLDAEGHVYLDHTGGGLHAASQIDAHVDLLRRCVLGNPHSNNPTSLAASALVERTRAAVCEFFHVPSDEYLCVFTPNATGALRLVGESYRFEPGGTFALSFDNHNSVNGIREFARRRGAAVAYVPVTAPELRLDRSAMTSVLRAGDPAARNLLAFPAQSNFSGVQHPLDLVAEAHEAGFDVLLDAAAFAPTNRLDVARHPSRLRRPVVLQDHRLPDRRRLPPRCGATGSTGWSGRGSRAAPSPSPPSRATATTCVPTRAPSKTARSTTSTSPPSASACGTSNGSGVTPSTGAPSASRAGCSMP